MQRLIFLCLVFSAACAVRGASEPPTPAVVATPLVEYAVPEAAVEAPLVTPVAFASEQPCERCLFVAPAQPKPGDFVMFETQAVPGVTSAMISVYGRDVRMFRVGERFRAFLGVPLSGDKLTYATRLWFAGANEPEGKTFSCMEHAVRERTDVSTESLRVARRFTSKRSLHQASTPVDATTTWVEPLDHEPFSQTLFLWPREGAVRSGFAVSRTYNKRLASRHMGLDIQGSVGDRAFASQAGVVRFSGKLRSTGNTVVIDHGAGVLTFYMHLSQRLKNVGNKVKQGELIGYVGRTGRVTGPHLHFAASVHGRFVDPESLLVHPLHASAPALPCNPDPSSHSVR